LKDWLKGGKNLVGGQVIAIRVVEALGGATSP